MLVCGSAGIGNGKTEIGNSTATMVTNPLSELNSSYYYNTSMN